MASENAKAVGIEAIKIVGKGLKLNKGDVIRKHGYKESIAINPKKVFDTKSCQEVVSPVVNRLESLRDRVIKSLDEKDFDKEKTNELNNLLKNLNHDIELLSGRATDRTQIDIDDVKDKIKNLSEANKGTDSTSRER